MRAAPINETIRTVKTVVYRPISARQAGSQLCIVRLTMDSAIANGPPRNSRVGMRCALQKRTGQNSLDLTPLLTAWRLRLKAQREAEVRRTDGNSQLSEGALVGRRAIFETGREPGE
jgi:hypothetical protein